MLGDLILRFITLYQVLEIIMLMGPGVNLGPNFDPGSKLLNFESIVNIVKCNLLYIDLSIKGEWYFLIHKALNANRLTMSSGPDDAAQIILHPMGHRKWNLTLDQIAANSDKNYLIF